MDFEQKCGNPTVGCWMSESPNPQNPTDPSWIPPSGIQRWAIICGTKFLVLKISNSWIQTCLTKKRMILSRPVYIQRFHNYRRSNWPQNFVDILSTINNWPYFPVGGLTVDIDRRWIDGRCQCRPYSPVGGSTVDVNINRDRSTDWSIGDIWICVGTICQYSWDHDFLVDVSGTISHHLWHHRSMVPFWLDG